jgi:hypothetical protein
MRNLIYNSSNIFWIFINKNRCYNINGFKKKGVNLYKHIQLLRYRSAYHRIRNSYDPYIKVYIIKSLFFTKTNTKFYSFVMTLNKANRILLFFFSITIETFTTK